VLSYGVSARIVRSLVFSAAVNALIGISVAYLFNRTPHAEIDALGLAKAHTQFESISAQNEAATLIAKTNST
jgi:L-cystine uptake protein TcyP (sodium:dicarboxylate symporter family)